jgi:hypothetical protein
MNETQLAAAVLASMGVKDHDPKVTGLLAEYLRRKCWCCCLRKRGRRAWLGEDRERGGREAGGKQTHT